MHEDPKRRLALPALAGVGILAALAMSTTALVHSGASNGPTATETAAKPATAPAKVLEVKIIGSYKPGPDGKRHDAYTQTEFAVKAGQPLSVRIDNTDNSPHSIASPEAGVDIVAMPGTHTYTMLVRKAGRFRWRCMMVCDTQAAGWAMTHPGYMSGYITAT
jgi:heme/copper-type cytochrome/quinol oxidase subunit 2